MEALASATATVAAKVVASIVEWSKKVIVGSPSRTLFSDRLPAIGRLFERDDETAFHFARIEHVVGRHVTGLVCGCAFEAGGGNPRPRDHGANGVRVHVLDLAAERGSGEFAGNRGCESSGEERRAYRSPHGLCLSSDSAVTVSDRPQPEAGKQL